MVELLKQGQYKPMAVADQVIVIYAGVNGFLDDVPVGKIQKFEEELLGHVMRQNPEIRKEVATKGKVDEALAGQLKQVLTAFKQKYGYGAQEQAKPEPVKSEK
jgi:F-type H+-transporting ATPase subunit alpha